MNMQKIKLFITLTCSLFLSLPHLQAGDAYSLSNYAEIATAALRGPLTALSYRNQGKKTGAVKTIHIATDVMRLANELLTIINHPQDVHYPSFFWTVFDASNLYIDIFGNNKKSDDTVELPEEQQQKINQLIQITQTYLLPLIESSTAFYQAINTGRSGKNCLYRRRAHALESLARATSTYLNHQQSKMAIVLLIGAIAQTTAALHASPPVRNRPVPPPGNNGNQPQNDQQNPVNNNGDNFNRGAWLNFDNEDQDGAANNNDDGFNWNYWNDPERDAEEARRAQEQLQQQQRENQARIDLAFRAGHLPEILRDAAGGLLVRRNGVVRVDASVQDPIGMEDWEAGAQVRVLACDHLVLEEHVPSLAGDQAIHCLICRQPRLPAQERVVAAP